MSIYLTAWAFDISVDSDKQQDIPYNTDISGTFRFDDFTTFELRYTWFSACNTSCGPGQQVRTLLGCYGSDSISYPTEACNAPNPDQYIYQNCNLWACTPPPPTYTGTWTANPAPTCPPEANNCWYTGSTPTGTVTCENGNCDPSAPQPSPKTRSCPATAPCSVLLSYTGRWTKTTPSCPYDCGYVGGDVFGTVTCENGNCDPNGDQEPNKQSCPATDDCVVVPTYTGTWTANPAPTCPPEANNCWYTGSTPTGTVTCENGNCDPSAPQPSPKTRSCPTTAPCVTSSPDIPICISPQYLVDRHAMGLNIEPRYACGTPLPPCFPFVANSDGSCPNTSFNLGPTGLGCINTGWGCGNSSTNYSDLRLKQNIRFYGIENGHNMYYFEYKIDPNNWYIWVMAQEILHTHPNAVILWIDGYYKVDYSLLWVQFRLVK